MFSLFYHLLSIFPYIFSSSFGSHCLSCGVFFSSSSGPGCVATLTETCPSIFLHFPFFTFLISAFPSKVARLPALVTSCRNLTFTQVSALPPPRVVLQLHRYLFPPNAPMVLSALIDLYFSTATVASRPSLKSMKAKQ